MSGSVAIDHADQVDAEKPQAARNEKAEDQVLSAFVQKPEKVAYYASALNKMKVDNGINFSWHWSWWAFFFTWAFLLYRKAYLPAAIAFVAQMLIGATGIGALVIGIAVGGTAPYLVLKRFVELKAQAGDIQEKQIELMRRFGGFHSWVVWVSVVMYLMLALVVFSVIAAA